MPEGDTIARTAERLRASLLGESITAARARPGPGLRSVPDLSRLVGAAVVGVESRGKHLLIGFDNGLTLRSHMRMTGSWHRYRPGERWRLPSRRATAIVETATAVAVAFDVPVLELLTEDGLRRSGPLRELGPDLLDPAVDLESATARLRALGTTALGEALLDQRAVAGIGNVVKSEAAFIERLDPWSGLDRFSDGQLLDVLSTASRILATSARDGRRITTGVDRPGRSLWVYRRAGRPCRRCGTLLLSRPQGEAARITYWCPRCQAAPG